MVSFLDRLRTARTSPIAAYTQFLLEYKQKERTVHAFFEGPEDESFYLNQLEANRPGNCQLFTYRCKNKSDVYVNYRLIDFNKHVKGRVLFFVDKDLSDFLGETSPTDTNIFVTTFYSIENYLVNLPLLVRVLREILHEFDDKRIKMIGAKFIKQYKIYCREMSLIMVWILLARRLGLRANLNNISLPKLFVVDKELRLLRTKEYTGPQFLDVFLAKSTGVVVPAKELKKRANVRKELIERGEPKLFIRGKFDLWFMMIFLTRAKEILVRTRSSGEQKCGSLPTLDEAANVLGPRVPAIDELTMFLQLNWSAL